MLLSPLVRQIVASLKQQSDRWQRDGRYLRRDDGVAVQFLNHYSNRRTRPRLSRPRQVDFNWVEAVFISRAIRAWMHRPV